MRRLGLVGPGLVAAMLVTGWAAPASAFDPAHVAQLLETNSCVGCNLQEADLVRANLDHADLAGANLEGARLVGASLICADLAGSNLVDSNLQGANIVGADLAGADITGANLRGAILLRNALWESVRVNVVLDGAIFYRSMSDAGLWGVVCE